MPDTGKRGENVMTAGSAAGEKISERLQESLAQLRKDIDRVELWAGALEGFSQPIPDYNPGRRYRLAPDERGSASKSAPTGRA
jgi:hypothetical protein